MNRIELVRTLELIKPALSKENTIPVFQCFTFRNNGTVAAYNDVIGIVGPSELELSCGIHGNTLLGLLSSSSAEEVEFSLKGEAAIIECGKTVSKLGFDPEENFIFNPPAMEDFEVKIPFTESVSEAIKMCLDTVSSDTAQPALLGVTIEGDRMYSCNGDAVTRVQIKKGVKERVLMSTPFCDAVLKLWKDTELTKGDLYFNDEWVFADFGDWMVYGRILKVSDPIDYEALIKKTIKVKTPTQAVPDDFYGALTRARVLADPESQKTTITISKGRAKIHTETHIGEIKDDLPMKGHPDVVGHVNASHLQKALEYCDQIAFLDNCTVFEKAPNVLQLVSNMS